MSANLPRRPPVTFDEHHEYIREQGRLEFFFLWKWLEEHPDEDFIKALREKVDIIRKTDNKAIQLDIASRDFNNPTWLRLESSLAELHSYLKGKNADASIFEGDAVQICGNDFLKCAEFSYYHGDWSAPFKEYQCGSLKFDAPGVENKKMVSFHIKNALCPKSIFDDKEYLPGCLLNLMDMAESQYGADTLGTGTWLNSLPRWLELFPAEWMTNMGTECRDVNWGYGHWGQFISAKGTFNRKYAGILRSTGDFPFWPKSSSCSFNSLRERLR